jgi:hypothetical protein
LCFPPEIFDMPPVRRTQANHRATPPQIAPLSANFESQLRESQSEDAIVAPKDSSSEAAVTTTVDGDTADGDTSDDTDEGGFNDNIVDTFDGIDWTRLQRYCKLLASQTQLKSWVYRHGYRVTLLANPKKIFFVCRYCHQRKHTNVKLGGIYNTIDSTSTTTRHLKQTRPGHGLVAPGKAVKAAMTTGPWLR